LEQMDLLFGDSNDVAAVDEKLGQQAVVEHVN
jgi:hypothetical protein